MNKNNNHNKYAPYWALIMFILWLVGLSTTLFNLGAFFNSYLLDAVGPAWNYILFRGLFTKKTNNIWTRFFSPTRTFIIFIIVTYGFEVIQYFKIYDSTYDPYDFIAYISILFPLFIIDKKLNGK